jgi:putative flippase GtrA
MRVEPAVTGAAEEAGPVPPWYAAVLEHTAFRYVVIGVLSAGVDFGLLYVLHAGLGVPVPVAAFVAVALAFVCNFALNRIWSFRSQAPVVGQFGRYVFLGAVNWVLTAVLVGGLTAFGMHYLVAKVIALVLTTASNYLLYRVWVFADRRAS